MHHVLSCKETRNHPPQLPHPPLSSLCHDPARALQWAGFPTNSVLFSRGYITIRSSFTSVRVGPVVRTLDPKDLVRN